jgi:hypothetical protein
MGEDMLHMGTDAGFLAVAPLLGGAGAVWEPGLAKGSYRILEC